MGARAFSWSWQCAGLLRFSEVIVVLQTYFPGFFPYDMLLRVYNTVIELSVSLGLDDSEGAGWTLSTFMKFVPILSLRCC